MGFLDTGNKKHQGQHRQEHLRLLSNDGDCVTFHRLTAYHLFLGSHFDGTLASRGARHGSELFFTRHWAEFIGNMPPPTTTWAFFGYLSFFMRKVRVSRFSQKPFGLKNVFKSPPWIWSKYPIHAVKKWMIMEGLSNSCLTWGISRDVGLGLGKKPITCSCRCEFPQDQKFQ